jgi:hypothetical protein
MGRVKVHGTRKLDKSRFRTKGRILSWNVLIRAIPVSTRNSNPQYTFCLDRNFYPESNLVENGWKRMLLSDMGWRREGSERGGGGKEGRDGGKRGRLMALMPREEDRKIFRKIYRKIFRKIFRKKFKIFRCYKNRKILKVIYFQFLFPIVKKYWNNWNILWI